MFKVYLLLGGNLGDRFAHLLKAKSLIEEHVGKIVRQSSVYETQAWGNLHQPDFLNCAVVAETNLAPLDLLKTTQQIETALGRERTQHWGARTMDIDIIFYGTKIIKHSDLIVPHPYLASRKFVLVPLTEMDPQLVHPQLNKTMEVLLRECEDKSDVKIII